MSQHVQDSVVVERRLRPIYGEFVRFFLWPAAKLNPSINEIDDGIISVSVFA